MRAASGVRTVTVARLLLSAYFFTPYIVVYAVGLGIPLSQILVVEGIFALLVVVLEVPSGWVADRITPRVALILSGVANIVGCVMLAMADAAWMYWAVQPVFAVAMVLGSGSDSALLLQALRREGHTEQFEPWESRTQSLLLATLAISYAMASALFLLGGAASTFWGTAAASLLGVMLVSMVSTGGGEQTGEQHQTMGLVRTIGLIVADLRQDPGQVRVLAAAVLTGTAFAVMTYLSPIYYGQAGFPESVFGLLAAATALVGAGISHLITGVHFGRALIFVLAVAAVLVSIPSAAVVVIAVAVLLGGRARAVGAYRRQLGQALSRHGDATGMSIASMAMEIGFAVLAPVLGVVSHLFGTTGLAATCAVMLVTAAVVSPTRARMST